MPQAHGIDRLIDANANRAAEGLRVLEDVARFLLDDAGLAERAKQARHELRRAIGRTGERDLPGDVGTTSAVATPRTSVVDLVRANAARAAEALRAAGEGSASVGRSGAAAACEAARYGVYTCESGLLARLPAWRLRHERLYVLVDPSLCADPAAVAGAAVRGGAGVVQLRAKSLAIRSYRDLAARVQDAVHQAGGLFVVNDHVAVARAIAADGVHVGQDDLAVADVRAVMHAGGAVGVSCHTPDQARAAATAGADAIGLGPMFRTSTKPHEPVQGPALLDALIGVSLPPAYAIGGMDETRVRDLRPRLLHGVAVSSAVCSAADPAAAAARLRAILDRP
jgi:thiamine-phosphate pyrophosphorylase